MKFLLNFFGTAAKTQTVKDTGIVFGGQVLSTLISAIFFILVARFLGPEKLGIYSMAMAIVIVLADTVDLAINSSIIKFYHQQNYKAYWKFAFLLKLLAGFVFSILLFFSAGILSEIMHQDLTVVLKVSSLLVFLVFFFRFPKSVFQAQKKFLSDALIDVAFSSLRLLMLLLLIYFSALSVKSALWTQIISALGIGLIALKFTGVDFLKAKVTPVVQKTFFSFHSWLTVGFILAAVHSRIDNLFLMRFSGPAMVGYYQVGYRFFMPIVQFSSVLSTVFAPRFASFEKEEQVKAYLKKTSLLSGGLALLVLVFIFFVPIIVKILFGADYTPTVLPTQILAVGFAFFVFAVPFFSCLIYRRGQTGFFALLNLLQLCLIVILDLLLIPKFQAVGAASAASLTIIIINVLAIFWVIRK